MTSSSIQKGSTQQGLIQKTIELSGQWPAVAEVSDATELSVETVKDAAEKGAVWLQAAQGKESYRKPRRVRSLDERFNRRDQILINYDSAVLAAVPPTVELVSDQVNYSVWCKPAGVLSQGTKWGDHCSMGYLVEKSHGKPALLVHRLDRAASGLMILAHTKNALVKLAERFAERKIGKTYRVRVRGTVDEKLPKVIKTPVAEKPALTTLHEAKVINSPVQSDGTSDKNAEHIAETLLTVSIETGRKHQIRSHMSSIGHPVIGDRLFDPEREHKRDLQLVSVGIELQCPFTDKLVSVRLPDHLNVLLSQAKNT